mmetsp:Transcript_15522/g.39986  ORF Transcript_15522/g.39986 Transcript_15522/m.39986 type:complete len:267 (+) Transcript_15522:90-890(+)
MHYMHLRDHYLPLAPGVRLRGRPAGRFSIPHRGTAARTVLLPSARMSVICRTASAQFPHSAEQRGSQLCHASQIRSEHHSPGRGFLASPPSNRLPMRARILASTIALSCESWLLALRKMQRPRHIERPAAAPSPRAMWSRASSRTARSCCCTRISDLVSSMLSFNSKLTMPPSWSPAGRHLSASARSSFAPHQHAPTAPSTAPSFAQGIQGRTSIAASSSSGRAWSGAYSRSSQGGSCRKSRSKTKQPATTTTWTASCHSPEITPV